MLGASALVSLEWHFVNHPVRTCRYMARTGGYPLRVTTLASHLQNCWTGYLVCRRMQPWVHAAGPGCTSTSPRNPQRASRPPYPQLVPASIIKRHLNTWLAPSCRWTKVSKYSNSLLFFHILFLSFMKHQWNTVHQPQDGHVPCRT